MDLGFEVNERCCEWTRNGLVVHKTKVVLIKRGKYKQETPRSPLRWEFVATSSGTARKKKKNPKNKTVAATYWVILQLLFLQCVAVTSRGEEEVCV